MFPPGNLRKLGLSSFNAFIKSNLIPFGLSLNVGGNRLIRLKFRDEEDLVGLKLKLKTLLVSGAADLGLRVKVCFVHECFLDFDGMLA